MSESAPDYRDIIRQVAEHAGHLAIAITDITGHIGEVSERAMREAEAFGTLQGLATHSGETATLELPAGRDMLIVSEIVSAHLLGSAPSLGTRWPMYATSTGKAYLAALPAEARLGWLDAAGRLDRKLFADKLTIVPQTSGIVLELADGAQLRADVKTPFLEGRHTIFLPRADVEAWRAAGLPGLSEPPRRTRR